MEDVKAYAGTLPQPQRRSTFSQPENIRRQADEVLIRRLMAQRATTAGIDRDAMVRILVQQAQEHVLSEAWIAQQVEAALPNAEMITRYAKELYLSQPDKFITGEQWKVRHILISPPRSEAAAAKAKTLLDELKAGAKFEEIAQANSADKTSAGQGGELDWFGATTMVKSFQDAVSALTTPGDLSGVVETQFGYHLIRLDAKRAAGQRTFEEVKADLERDVLAALRKSTREQLVAKVMPNPTTNVQAIEALAREFAKP